MINISQQEKKLIVNMRGRIFNTFYLVCNYWDQRYDAFQSSSDDGYDDLHDEDEYELRYEYDRCE